MKREGVRFFTCPLSMKKAFFRRKDYMKKVLALMLAFAMVFSLAACGGNTPANQGSNEQPSNTSNTPKDDPNSLAGEYAIKVWAAEANMDLMKRQIEAYNSSNDQGIKFTATINQIGRAHV